MEYKLGINGVITFKNCKLIDVINEVGIEHVVFETDSPYLTPVPDRGKINDPSYVNNIVDFISQYPEEVGNPDDIIFDIDGSVKFYNEKGIYTQLYPNVNIELASTNYGKNGTRSAGMRLIEEPFIYSDDNKGGPLKTLTITNNEFNEMLKYCCCNFVSNSDGKLINNFSSVWGGSTITSTGTSTVKDTYKYIFE
jgi:hypothetical protein